MSKHEKEIKEKDRSEVMIPEADEIKPIYEINMTPDNAVVAYGFLCEQINNVSDIIESFEAADFPIPMKSKIIGDLYMVIGKMDIMADMVNS